MRLALVHMRLLRILCRMKSQRQSTNPDGRPDGRQQLSCWAMRPAFICEHSK